jgi:hypothetical protein
MPQMQGQEPALEETRNRKVSSTLFSFTLRTLTQSLVDFSLVVVAENPLYTTTTNGLFRRMLSCFSKFW